MILKVNFARYNGLEKKRSARSRDVFGYWFDQPLLVAQLATGQQAPPAPETEPSLPI